MTTLFVCILVRGGRPLTRFDIILFVLFAGVVVLVGISRAILQTWIKRTRGRKWPTATAKVDIVSVADLSDNPRRPGYLATLTYVYRNPDEQVGEYSRQFGNKGDAQAWADSYKDSTVMVHVDPRDSTRSVLREEDL